MRTSAVRSKSRIGLSIVSTAALMAAVAPAALAAQSGEAGSLRPALCRYDPDCPDVVDTSGALTPSAAATETAPATVQPAEQAGPVSVTAAAPAVVANGPANPPNAVTGSVVGGRVTLLAKSAALAVTPYVFPSRPTSHRSIAPHTTTTGLSDGRILFRVKQPARMVVYVPASTVFDLRVRVQGQWQSLGASTSDERGWLSLPVVSATRPGMYLISIFDTQRGGLTYVKFDVRA